jgi:inhibitor of cysteine peptidase
LPDQVGADGGEAIVSVELSTAGGGTYRLARNEEVVVRLPENPTTGYRWHITHSGDGELVPTGDAHVMGPDGATPGAAGQRVLRFVARKSGSVSLKAVMRRPWEAADAAQETRVYTFAIE